VIGSTWKVGEGISGRKRIAVGPHAVHGYHMFTSSLIALI